MPPKLFAAAALLAAVTPAFAQTCSTGILQCCELVEKASDPAAAAVLKSIGVVVQDVDTLIGLTCSPITVIGVGTGDSCSASTVCCDDNSHGSLISVGCVPVTD
ncbi:hydrophobin [Epithele typhae]|uniref:hydrophobin n=1 Tax=Epithele typhae TaxID=378194 RepID=UPI002007BE90|nr:hydrophobin [Epithele typhae]KAH9940201.1 hydrophobin [Epithele typhae]